MKVLITGGSGFLGAAIVERLTATHPEWTLINLDISPPRAPQSDTTFTCADITSSSSLDSTIMSIQPDVIIHTAGIVPKGQERYTPTPSTAALVYTTNVQGTANVLHSARLASVPYLVYTSSCTVLSDDTSRDYAAMNETYPVPAARDMLHYGLSKQRAENLVLDADADELCTCALRPATVIGPGDGSGVIEAIASVLTAKWQTCFVLGDGGALFDFVHVRNVAHAHVLAVERLLDPATRGRVRGQAFFVSNAEPLYFRDLMLEVWWRCGGHVPAWQVRVPRRVAGWMGWAAEWSAWVAGRETALSAGSVADAVGTRYADCSKAESVLGYVPIIEMADAVREVCDDYVTRQRVEAGEPKGVDRRL